MRTALSMAQEAAPAVEWGCLTQQQKFMVQFLFVLVFSVIAVPLPLLIPINDPNLGALGNMSFFYGYNIFVIVYYLPGRLLALLVVSGHCFAQMICRHASTGSACDPLISRVCRMFFTAHEHTENTPFRVVWVIFQTHGEGTEV